MSNKFCLVLDEDEFGDYYYFLDHRSVQVTPNFETREDAVEFLVKNNIVQEYTIERRKYDVKTPHRRRITDIKFIAK